MTALERHLRKWMEKAIADFALISAGDGVAVGVSGGKDSLTLLHLLAGPLIHAPSGFRLVALHVDAGIPGANPDGLVDHFKSIGVDYEIIEATDIFEKSQNADSKKRPCFVCSRLRRQALANAAHRLGCGKIALAHHRDDAVETFMMNVCFNREVSTMLPIQPLFGGAIGVIRPLYYIRENKIAMFSKQAALPVLKHRCPTEDVSRRRIMKNMLREMETVDPHVNESIFRSMFRIKSDYLPAPMEKLELPKDF